MRRALVASLALTLVASAALRRAAASPEKRVCVEVRLQQPHRVTPRRTPASGPASAPTLPAPLAPYLSDHDEPATARAVAAYRQPLRFLPLGQTPLAYLRRLVEHYVTHEVGFVAVPDRCEATIRIELYPLQEGWTAFARYSGNGREERIDQLFPHELSQYAERVSLALLHDVPISTTIRRDTVLRADSMRAVQRIRGAHHFVLGLGTQLRFGKLATAQNDGSARSEWRLFSPMTLGVGYLGKFESWALETSMQLGIGTSRTGMRLNTAGGHLDLGGDFGISIHFFRYLSPRGITSFYLGAGSSFELLWFSGIVAAAERPHQGPRSTLYGGGLDVDLLCGVEFMRASSVQFYLQGGLQLPAYVVKTEDEHAGINTWFPAVVVKMGMMF
jgi:hypothetical protein